FKARGADVERIGVRSGIEFPIAVVVSCAAYHKTVFIYRRISHKLFVISIVLEASPGAVDYPIAFVGGINEPFVRSNEPALMGCFDVNEATSESGSCNANYIVGNCGGQTGYMIAV